MGKQVAAGILCMLDKWLGVGGWLGSEWLSGGWLGGGWMRVFLFIIHF